ncbi:MAG: transposase, partial [Hydrocarboniphaga sp.]|nr:transposase [Hydrocarboniphaga sp.]
FFMLSRKEPYRDTVIDFQALSVKRNAPRWIKALTQYGLIPAAS